MKAPANWTVQVEEILLDCFKRIGTWRTPCNWSTSGWLQELRAYAVAAAYEAETTYDPGRGVPLTSFVYLRVVARALTYCRREWAYAHECVPDANSDDECGDTPAACLPSAVSHQDLHNALESLSEDRRWVVQQLFWQGRTEANLALELGITQRAVSKRKQAAVQCLRDALREAGGQVVPSLTVPRACSRKKVFKKKCVPRF